MDYDLSRLSTRTFEQLVQALAIKTLGSGMMVFGDGPDGGREASYVGKVSYPNEKEPWEGTIVLQAKFRQRPVSTRSDTTWAASQLKDELEATFKTGSARVRPTHFIFATNVGLSSVPKKGGKARLEAVAKRFPLEDFHVWDRDKIGALLDNAKSVRNAFLGYICPGDVLAEIRKHVRAEAPDFDKVISNFLEKELLADQYANLEQAGRVADEKIPISQVFVDLPTQDDEDDKAPEGLAEQLLAIASERLNPTSYDESELWDRASDPGEPVKGRLVLIGGPGQGKTTLGQFVCQLFRTSLLQSRPTNRVSADARSAMALIASQCEEDEVALPHVRRFPIRIPLTELSDKLASANPPTSLLEFMVDRINRRVSRSLPAETLRTWLGEYPWLLVLDGLDEVPASSNRAEILDLIRDFWVDAANEDADVLVLATTRPQGYNDDFSPEFYRHIALAPLSQEHALRYGRRLAQARHGSDEEKCTKVIERLEQAVQSPATSKLMTSPLQVTIMATLVDQGGQPPRERWNLFSRYYSVIYMREVEREISAAEVLKEHKPNIDAIHRRVALILQAEGEQAGQGEARMSADRFAAIVRQRLIEEGHRGTALAELEGRIIKAAGDRLVFLVGLKEDEVGFEIRSLQEFMAAEALMDGGEEPVTARLRAIAGVASWRNVFLFAAGKCYEERQHLRDTIYAICVETNKPTQDPLGAVVRPGSVLAADLLTDGFSLNQPTHSQLLGTEVLKLLPGPGTNARLLHAYDPALEDTYKSAIEKALEGKANWVRRRALALLLRLSGEGIAWATSLLDTTVPATREGLVEALEATKDLQGDPPSWVSNRIMTHIAKLSDVDIVGFSNLLRSIVPGIGAISQVKDKWPSGEESFSIRGMQGEAFHFTLRSTLRQTNLTASLPDELGNAWPGLGAAVAFAESPSHTELATQLHQIARTTPPTSWGALAIICPWPLGASLAHAKESPEILHDLAARAEIGELGSIDDWRSAEKRWAQGVIHEDLAYSPADGPFDKSIGEIGFPITVSGWRISAGEVKATVKTLTDWLDGMENHAASGELLNWVIAFTRIRDIDFTIDSQACVIEADTYASALFNHGVDGINLADCHFLMPVFDWAQSPSVEEERLLNLIGESIGPLSPDFPWRHALPVEEHLLSLLRLWNTGHETNGLYRAIALTRPAAESGRRPKMKPPSRAVAKANPGATALLALKEKNWSGKRLNDGISLLTETAGAEPIWLRAAVNLFRARLEERTSERALGMLWNVATSGSLREADFEVIAPEIGHLASDMADRRATTLLEPKTWKELAFFEVPPAAE